MFFSSINNHDVFQIFKSGIEKNKYDFSVLEEMDKKIVDYILETFKNGSIAFGLREKKVVKAIYIFKIDEYNGSKSFVLDKKLYVSGLGDTIEKFEKTIGKIFYSVLKSGEITKAIWNNTLYERVRVKLNDTEFVMSYAWMAMGLVYLVFMKSYMWFFIGVCFFLANLIVPYHVVKRPVIINKVDMFDKPKIKKKKVKKNSK